MTIGLTSSSVTVLCLGIAPVLLKAQAWEPAGVPFWTTEISNLALDTVADALYFCGESSLNNDNSFDDQAISVYSNGQWDTIGVFNNRPRYAITWDDTLIVGGSFYTVNGLPYARIAAYAGGQWLPFGDVPVLNGSVDRFKVINGILYVIGSFEYMDGYLCNGIAKRVGGHWENVGTMDVNSPPQVQDLVEWNGQLIATGVIRFSNGLPRDVAWFDGTDWHPLGPGITGWASAGRALAVFQGDLYVGGSIDIQEGNVGHGIMRWDGTQYHPVGGSVQGNCGTFSCPAGVLSMVVRDSLLFAAGSLSYVAQDSAFAGVATWDGSTWCPLPGLLRRPVSSIAFYHDTLYAAPFHDVEGVDANCAGRFIGDHAAYSCLSTAAHGAPSRRGTTITVSPVPTSGPLTISTELTWLGWSFRDMVGRLVDEGPYRSSTIDVANLQEGIYLLCLTDKQGRTLGTVRFVRGSAP